MYFSVDLSPLVQEEFQVLFLHLSFYNRANKRDSFLINGIEQIYEQTVHGLGIEFIPLFKINYILLLIICSSACHYTEVGSLWASQIVET